MEIVRYRIQIKRFAHESPKRDDEFMGMDGMTRDEFLYRPICEANMLFGAE